MKCVFLFCLIVLATLGICNCSVEPSQNNAPTKTEIQKEPEQKPETQEVIPPVIIPPIITPPEIVPPEIIPPVVIPPEVTPPEVVSPEDGTQGVETGEGETSQGGENTDGEPEEGETVEGETTETETHESESEENKPEDGETIETDTTETENPIEEIPGLAILQINELRTEFSSAVNNVEYIEFKVIKGGGMEGLYLYSIMNNAQDYFLYIFPPIDVETGEYITLHLRTLDKYNSCDELRDDLTISGGYESCPTARDLWVSGNTKLLYKSGIVYIQDSKDRIMDAIIMDEKPGTTWNNYPAAFADITERLFKEGMWKSAEGNKPKPKDSVNTSAIGTSVYKSVSRYEGRENTHSANDWYITTAGFFTPGLPNK
jgi:hypothetical protein